MKKLLFILMSFITLGLSAQESVYDFTVKGLNNEDVSLKDYSGKVLLIVNTATKCGFTPQYKELQALYEKYQARGFEVLDFPCNQFGEQAPGTNEEMDQMMSRRDPGYKDKSDIKWNFTKFLVNKKGEVIARFEPSDSMMKLETAIRRNL